MPSMMSKEKEAEDGACIFHRWRQAWKSRKVSHFLGKLDNLLKKNSKISIPAQELFFGDPLDVSAPTTAKSWLTDVSGLSNDKENIDPKWGKQWNESLLSDSGAD